ncbi:MAG: DUF4149 domain-containing protein [Acidiferrobacterales bacterium]
MKTILILIILAGLVTWVGGIAFFSFIVAPVAFRVLEQKEAGRLVRAIFPRYYKLGVACGVLIAVSSLILLATRTGFASWLVAETGVTLLMTTLALYSLMLAKRINLARDAGEAQELVFKRLHRRSVLLNTCVLLLGFLNLGIIAHFAVPLG